MPFLFYLALIEAREKRKAENSEILHEINASTVDLLVPSYITVIEKGASMNATLLTSVKFEPFSSLTRIGKYAFANCPRIRTIDLSLCNNLWIIQEGAFFNSSLEIVTLPSSLKYIENSVFELSNISQIEIPRSVIVIGEKCFFKSSLQQITFQKHSLLSEIGPNSFAETFLFSITLPDNLKNIGYSAFTRSQLHSISFETKSNYFEINNKMIIRSQTKQLVASFYYEQESITIPDGITEISKGGFLLSPIEDCKFPSSLLYIRERAFAVSQLVNLTIPSSVKLIDKYAFHNCYQLRSLVIESENTVLADNCFGSNFQLCGINCPIKMIDRLMKVGIQPFSFQKCISKISEKNMS
ncbi:surface antigen Bsp, putative [Trichomonas vaginalis G3]|uniref:Surface antigen Bsp, putative n=1 Tax=Trichomonas vaginalis (strain ATCC PRA-98 / G3) TaxID=412133 RepID=A2EYD7_TRIV3|nr:ribonuclease inhibitor domain-containing protein [Trichomonas vaginalis G3]EAY02364.1 surface antigen Bsp, putative [Trichomonas vaginalis G3]KAI5514024.1 ribonuclease inhibitor domain-containing protein [Trichomonas vaginalis G3]|eukprot:XP_001330631.1 surface antigen Bsp [Trichomonas vaginalis G3]